MVHWLSFIILLADVLEQFSGKNGRGQEGVDENGVRKRVNHRGD